MPDTSLIGLTLAGFRITGVIGEGGMATVYRGLKGEKEDEVAVKIMNPDLAKESRFVRRFRREAKAAAMLKHPNTVQILEFGVDQGYVFLAMELLKGNDLAMLLHRERRIPDFRAMQIVIQVCRALSAAHQQSIVHRDLKPDNIMLVRAPEGASPIAGLAVGDFVKVLDFGIAKILDDEGGERGGDPRAEPITQEKSMLTRVGTIVGTPAYMAPEQGRAEPVDARTDIYACGVLLYELITGRVPFTGETPMQVVMRHVNEPARPPSEHCPVKPDLERLIMRALAKYPSERQQSAEELAFELLALLPTMLPSAATEEHGVNKTLVIETGAVPQKPAAPRGFVSSPRPAAGVPARPAAGAPLRAGAGAGLEAAASAAKTVPNPAHFAGDAASPFPTLNIEVPDDIFPQGLGPPTTGAPTSTDPAPTRRIDPAQAPSPERPRSAAAVPVVVAGAERAGLMQTMQSHGGDEKAPPSAPSDDDEAATVIKAPNEADRARMSLAEEAMAKALGQPLPAPAAGVGQGLPKFSDAESVEPTLVAPGGSSAERAATSPSANNSLAHERTEVSGLGLLDAPIDLKALEATVKLEPEEFDRVKNQVPTRASAADAAAGTGSPPPLAGGDGSAPVRKPTSELMPLNLPEDRSSSPAVAGPAETPLVWEPKGRKLTGATALIVGIAIGAVLVVIGLAVILLVRGAG